MVRAHVAAERGERLAASSLARQGIAMLLRSHGRERAAEGDGHAARPEVLRARELLAERLVDPPTLEELAAHTGVGAFVLSRAFRAAYGLPPHAYLNQVRVDRARSLLLQGRRASEVAAEVGFADQPHLTRHFRRHLGVPPAAYQRTLRAC